MLTSQAEAAAARATVKQMEADVVRATAQRSYRAKEYHRMEELFARDAIDKRLVDEKEDATEAARAAELGAKAAVEKSKAEADAADARIAQAKTDVEHAEADVEVAAAVLAKQKVLLDYTRIESPYDGVVTSRKFHRGSFILAADHGGDMPLLTVARTDVVRVVVQVPDRDVPYTNVGDAATIEIDALPGKLFTGKVSRVADSENPQTRTMRVEIDLPNDKDLLREGMYGRATIQLEPPSAALTIPAGALSARRPTAKGRFTSSATIRRYCCRSTSARTTACKWKCLVESSPPMTSLFTIAARLPTACRLSSPRLNRLRKSPINPRWQFPTAGLRRSRVGP